MRKATVSIALGLLVTGCASNPGVAPLGPDSYVVSRQAATAFSGLGSLRAKALREADEFCKKQGRALRVVHTKDSEPPYIFGNYPRTEVEFMCLRPDDPELTRHTP